MAQAPTWHNAPGTLPAGWRVQVLSGVGSKRPAAISVQTPHWHVLLDAGAALEPEATHQPPAWVGLLQALHAVQPPDAVVISHDHVDHMAGHVHLPPEIPRYATPPVAARLGSACVVRHVPLCGQTVLRKSGAPSLVLRTGANGHSLGGVWLHLSDPAQPGASVWYSGDMSLESAVFRVDLPPAAALALVDASYGLYDTPLGAAQAVLATHTTQPLALPVPPSGRLLEVALWLQQAGLPMVLDDVCLDFAQQAVAQPSEQFVPGVAARLQQWLQAGQAQWGDAAVQHCLAQAKKRTGPSPVLLLADPAPNGLPGKWVAQLLADAQRRHAVVFTGHCPRPVSDTSWYVSPRNIAQLRWNVHPRQRDLAALLSLLQPRQWCPLFTAHTAQQLVSHFQGAVAQGEPAAASGWALPAPRQEEVLYAR